MECMRCQQYVRFHISIGLSFLCFSIHTLAISKKPNLAARGCHRLEVLSLINHQSVDLGFFKKSVYVFPYLWVFKRAHFGTSDVPQAGTMSTFGKKVHGFLLVILVPL